MQLSHSNLEIFQELYPEKFVPIDKIFSHIHRGDSIFVGTACGEPQYLVNSFVDYISNHPSALFDAEIIQVFTLGLAPYTNKKFKRNFRHNCFFIGATNREAVNTVMADYAPTFLSEVPGLIASGQGRGSKMSPSISTRPIRSLRHGLSGPTRFSSGNSRNGLPRPRPSKTGA